MLEIEQRLNITITMPQTCHFCGEEIVKKYGRESESLCFHSLDGNHDNWDPANKVPAHIKCHTSFHKKGEPHPWMKGNKHHMKRPENRARHSKVMKARGAKKVVATTRERYTPEEISEFGRKGVQTRLKHHGPEEVKEQGKRGWITRRKRYGSTGFKPLTPEEKKKDYLRRSEAAKKGWKKHRELHGPTGMKPKEEIV